MRFKKGINIKKEKIEKMVESKLNIILSAIFGIYGWQYLNKLRKSFIIAKILFTFVLWNL